MSEAARNLYEHSGVYTQTTGNITRLFFGRAPHPEAEVTTPASRYQDQEPEQVSTSVAGSPAASFSSLYNDMELPAATETADAHLTSRQKELLKPDAVNMAVQPLENFDQVKGMIDYFANKGKYREACLLVFGFCTGLRISDLLLLKLGDVVTSIDPIVFKPAIDIREQKTGKRTISHLDEMLITPAMQEAFRQYISQSLMYYDRLDRYLFTTSHTRGLRPMTIRTIQLSLAPAFAAVCPHLHCSTHTMRKTFVSIVHVFASQCQMSGGGLNPTTACQIALRHANASTTMAYMGTMKSGMLSLRRAVSDFVQGRTKLKSLKSEYCWELEDD